jgi:transcription termination factor Rho
MKIIFLFLILFLQACIHENDTIKNNQQHFDNYYYKNASLIEQIEYDKHKNFDNSFDTLQSQALSYIIEPTQTASAVTVINGAVIHSSQKYSYLHKINLFLSCGDQTNFMTLSRIQFKKMSWKISDTIQGEKTTNSNGHLHIIFRSESENKFKNIEIKTKSKSYEINPIENLILKLDSSDC